MNKQNDRDTIIGTLQLFSIMFNRITYCNSPTWFVWELDFTDLEEFTVEIRIAD